jgi:pSer/pThr/pTyr-binding forkhead associated (FHA) protein
MASLHVRKLGGDAQGLSYPLEKEEVTLGRSAECDVVVPCIHASRRHAQVIRVGVQFYVEDMGSTGSTRVNGPGAGNQIRGRTLLRDQDEIWFGNGVVVQFRELSERVGPGSAEPDRLFKGPS